MHKNFTEAIIIKKLNLLNGDVILTVFTPFVGKLSLVARQGQKSIKRFGGSLDIISKINIEFFEKNGSTLGKIISIDLIDDYPCIKSDYDKIMIATYFIDLVGHFHPDKLPVPNSYKLLSMFFTYMNSMAPLGSICEAFQTKLLCAVGLKLNTRYCSSCGVDFLKGEFEKISFNFNSVFCKECITAENFVKHDSIKFIETVSMSPIKDFLGLKASMDIVEDLRYYIDHHIDCYLGKRLKSRDMVP